MLKIFFALIFLFLSFIYSYLIVYTSAVQASSCVSCNIQNPIIDSSSPTENTQFTVTCPAGPNANPAGACRGSTSPKWCNGITAYVDNQECTTFQGWTDQGARFICNGFPAGTHTAKCNVAANQDCWPGNPKTCGESSQYSFVIQASPEGKFDHYLFIRITDVNTGQNINMQKPDYMGGGRCSSGKLQVNLGDHVKIDWILYKLDGSQETGNPSTSWRARMNVRFGPLVDIVAYCALTAKQSCATGRAELP